MFLLTVFANIRVDNEERFIRMKDSFDSFSDIEAEWIVNIRGNYGTRCKEYIENKISNRCKVTTLESGNGWMSDSKKLAQKINTKYVMVWVEDHICMCISEHINDLVQEIDTFNVEYMNHTWYFNGLIHEYYADIEKTKYDNISCFTLTKSIQKNLKFGLRRPYIISMPSFFSRDLFTEIVSSKHPYLRRWPKETPFDFEKGPKDYKWLPIKMAIPHKEIFACIDDDNGVEGYSLQSRGLYESREKRNTIPRQMKWTSIRKITPAWFFSLLKRLRYHL